jgi:hypothetical protein
MSDDTRNMLISLDHQKAELESLAALAGRSSQVVDELIQEQRRLAEEAAGTYDHDRQCLAEESAQVLGALEYEYLQELEKARLAFEQNVDQAHADRNITSDDVSRHRALDVDSAKDQFEASQTQIQAVYEDDCRKTDEAYQKLLSRCETEGEMVASVIDRATLILGKRGCSLEPMNPPAGMLETWSSTHLRRVQEATDRSMQIISLIKSRASSRYLDEGWSILLAIVLILALAYPLYRLIGVAPLSLGLSLLISVLLTTVVHFVVVRLASRATEHDLPQLRSALQEAEQSLLAAGAAAKREHQAALAELAQRRERQMADSVAQRDRCLNEAEERYQARRAKLERLFVNRQKELETKWSEQTRHIGARYTPLIEQRRNQFQARQQRLADEYQTNRVALDHQFQLRWQVLAQEWSAGYRAFETSVAAMNRFCRNHFSPFQQTDWSQWCPNGAALTSIKIGQYELDAEMLAGQWPRDDRLLEASPQFTLPVTLAFPDRPSLILNAQDEGRSEAVRIIRNAMLRLLTSLPPGRVRFTIIDPTGLGQNFSAFMHLTDFDERLVNSRIWTETAHINQRLADLTEHMENVIQKYLRNEFASIQAYNAYAGEIAEAFQILVVANFPANFSEEACRRLTSIMTSGPRCGVYTLLSRDLKLGIPRGFEPGDLAPSANTFTWNGTRFEWDDNRLRSFPVQFEEAPDERTTTAILKAIGRHAVVANRVEVPFECVAPASDEYWSNDSRSELRVAIGRAGATRLLTMVLGEGTSQHVLISGKTGSGKSTLLHAMITNLALRYSPHEVQFYLIDFKKGVEFKGYAEHQLPHARVIAIESEREFGMSVLQRLDQELRRRGDLFRQAGVQSLKAYRDLQPDAVLPRVLLIVDEFQEFFVNDDRISHEASLLLDRLVRQGRAFGLHVVLGSQTLAGAYSLARSTIGQMAVRIALQCSAADAHLILSEENTSARLLGRPGEAIYNDASGLIEGNHPFQVVWLSDQHRSAYLKTIRDLTERHRVRCEPPIVFEGNAAADMADNGWLRRSLELLPASGGASGRAWLGAPIAIKEPTSITLKRQHASHLLIVGQQPELAAGILTSAVVGIAAGRPPRAAGSAERSVRFEILDGLRTEFAKTTFGDRLASHLPLDLRVWPPNSAAKLIEELAAEINDRQKREDYAAEPVYLVVYDLARFRDLQADDDLGFSSFGGEEKNSISQQLVTIVRDGPPVGVHVLVWADSFNNVNRWFNRQTIREFGSRVLFQMSAVDSSNLIDTAAAAQLGPYRAILYSDDRADIERFRPYAPATPEWLDWVRDRLAKPIVADQTGSVAPEARELVT